MEGDCRYRRIVRFLIIEITYTPICQEVVEEYWISQVPAVKESGWFVSRSGGDLWTTLTNSYKELLYQTSSAQHSYFWINSRFRHGNLMFFGKSGHHCT